MHCRANAEGVIFEYPTSGSGDYWPAHFVEGMRWMLKRGLTHKQIADRYNIGQLCGVEGEDRVAAIVAEAVRHDKEQAIMLRYSQGAVHALQLLSAE